MILFAYVPRPRNGDPVRLRAFIEEFAPLAEIDEGVQLEVMLARGILEDLEREESEVAISVDGSADAR